MWVSIVIIIVMSMYHVLWAVSLGRHTLLLEERDNSANQCYRRIPHTVSPCNKNQPLCSIPLQCDVSPLGLHQGHGEKPERSHLKWMCKVFLLLKKNFVCLSNVLQLIKASTTVCPVYKVQSVNANLRLIGVSPHTRPWDLVSWY